MTAFKASHDDGQGWRVRLAQPDDVAALLAMARRTGGGLTNLPPDGDALAARIERSTASCDTDEADRNALFLLVLEHAASGRIGGTGCLFSHVGLDEPFYTYRLSTVTGAAVASTRQHRQQCLHLTNDFYGCTEVGGLFLDPDLRGGGLGRLLARARYLFIAQHRERFDATTLAELRGWIDPSGLSPFWEGLGRHFFEMSFDAADRHGGVHGNSFIADLMPRWPVYVALLPETARAAIGRPHADGIAALTLLHAEGFRYEGYVDIFDAGPTVSCATDDIGTIKAARTAVFGGVSETAAGASSLICTGRLRDFTVWRDRLSLAPDTAAMLATTPPLSILPGTEIRHVAF